MRTASLVLVCTLVSVAPALAQAQDRIAPGTHVGSAVAASGYDEGNRRDPFVSLLVPKKTAQPAAAASRPRAGLGGLALADVSVKGIVRSGSSVMAILEGPEGKSFVAHSQDHLQDAVVKSIDATGVVFAEQQLDATGVMRPRDVRKPLRPVGEGVR